MKIDLSTIALILLLVVPGLVAKRSRRRLSSQSLDASGPATELGELVAFSLAVHLLLIFLTSTLAVLVSLLLAHSAVFPFQLVDRIDLSTWSGRHRSETTLLGAGYLCLSVAAAYLLGTFTGWLRLNNPLLQRLEANPRLKRAIKHLGIFSLVEERPISFELFTGESVARKTDLIFFLEIRLRDEKGFVTGELVTYAIVKDEESHRPVILRNAQFRQSIEEDYQPMEGDRLLIDLADALLVQVSYR